ATHTLSLHDALPISFTTPPSTSWPSMGSWLGRMPISPSVVCATTNEAWPDHSRRSTATSSTDISATWGLLLHQRWRQCNRRAVRSEEHTSELQSREK